MVKTLRDAEQYLQKFVQKELIPGNLMLKRMEYFLNLLGNPQDKVKIIHVAGTSGKSSTAYLISKILSDQGLKTGLHLSPHLYQMRERWLINNQLITKGTVCNYVKRLKPYIEKMDKSPYKIPTFYELALAMAFLLFYEEKVDYAVIETGLGGLLDPTNSVHSEGKVAVLTKIGLDHTEILGNTLEKIAREKAGIIKHNNTVITIEQDLSVLEVFDEAAEKNNSYLQLVRPLKNFSIKEYSEKGTKFDFYFADLVLENVTSPVLGDFQIENLALAITTVKTLQIRDKWKFHRTNLINTINQTVVPGRLQIIKDNEKSFIIDGAHNEQKMLALVHSLKKIFPEKKFIFLIAFKHNKDYPAMLKHIVEIAEKIVITRFIKEGQDMVHKSVDTDEISYELNKLDYHSYQIEENPEEGLKACLVEKDMMTVVTGSIYFIGDFGEKNRDTLQCVSTII
jgi:dihydrofolate synthase/folylpolyglutamate synthase